jgi:hypothetical protein
MAGPVGWYGRWVRLGGLLDDAVPALVAFALCNLGVLQRVTTREEAKWLLGR